MEHIFANATSTIPFDPLIHTNKRHDSAATGLQLHMVLVRIHMKNRYLLPHHRFYCRNCIPDLTHDRLLCYKTTGNYTAGFGIGHFTSGIYQFQTDTVTDSLIAFQPHHIVDGITVATFAASIICSMVRYYPQLCDHLPHISPTLHYKSGFLATCLIRQQLGILLLIASCQQSSYSFSDPLGEVNLCYIQADFTVFEEFFNLALELFNLACYNIFHREQLSFGLWCLSSFIKPYLSCSLYLFISPTLILH